MGFKEVVKLPHILDISSLIMIFSKVMEMTHLQDPMIVKHLVGFQ